MVARCIWVLALLLYCITCVVFASFWPAKGYDDLPAICLPHVRFEMAPGDEQIYKVCTVSRLPPTQMLQKRWYLRDRTQGLYHVYERGYFMNARLVPDDRYDLFASLLPDHTVQLQSNHTWNADRRRSRYVQWPTALTSACEVPASQFAYRLISSLYDRPIVWVYQTNTNEHGASYNNRIMDGTDAPSLSVFRTWYCWMQNVDPYP